MCYEAKLNDEEVGKFCGNFFGLDTARDTKIEIVHLDAERGKFQVTLTPNEGMAESLDNLFEFGLLSDQGGYGWNKKFKKYETAIA